MPLTIDILWGSWDRKHYALQVVEVTEENGTKEYQVRFLKEGRGGTYTWPGPFQAEDVSFVTRKELVKIDVIEEKMGLRTAFKVNTSQAEKLLS